MSPNHVTLVTYRHASWVPSSQHYWTRILLAIPVSHASLSIEMTWLFDRHCLIMNGPETSLRSDNPITFHLHQKGGKKKRPHFSSIFICSQASDLYKLFVGSVNIKLHFFLIPIAQQKTQSRFRLLVSWEKLLCTLWTCKLHWWDPSVWCDWQREKR